MKAVQARVQNQVEGSGTGSVMVEPRLRRPREVRKSVDSHAAGGSGSLGV